MVNSAPHTGSGKHRRKSSGLGNVAQLMTKTQTQHPGTILGEWLCGKRKLRNMVARVFANTVWLTHAKYAEVELGITKWLTHKQEVLIPLALCLNEAEKKEFNEKLAAARSVKDLAFSDIFSRESMRPVRACHHQ